jgi:hypothetical protein
MSNDTPAVATALQADAVLYCTMVQIDLPDYTLRLVDGGSDVVVVTDAGSATFLAADPTFGTLGGINSLADGMEAEAPRPTVTILPPSNTAAADLANPAFQGAFMAIWRAALNLATGAVIPVPLVQFVGAIDVPTLRVGRGSRVLEIQAASEFDAFLEDVEVERLSDAFHQSIFPGELGLTYVTGVLVQPWWGVDAPAPAVQQTTT